MANAIAKTVVLAGDMIYKEREIDCKLTKSGVNWLVNLFCFVFGFLYRKRYSRVPPRTKFYCRVSLLYLRFAMNMLVSDTPDVENINVLYLPTSFVPGFGICLVCWNPFQSGIFWERWQKIGQKSRNLDPNSTFFGLKIPGPGHHISVGMMCRCTLRCVSKCIHHLWPNGAPWRPILRLAALRPGGILQLAGWFISMGKSIYKILGSQPPNGDGARSWVSQPHGLVNHVEGNHDDPTPVMTSLWDMSQIQKPTVAMMAPRGFCPDWSWFNSFA